jgi:lysozyme
MSQIEPVPLDTVKTPVNPTGRGGWVAVAVVVIMTWEGFAAVGHHDPIDPKGVNTIGYGHIENVSIGDRVTKVEAGKLLTADLPRYEKQVEHCIHVPMPGYRHAAIISFTYNVGGGALCKSSVARYINAGEPNKGCDALMLYVKSNGKFRQGLQNRRTAERKLCLDNNEPPLPNKEVMAEPTHDVDQAVANKEAAAVPLPRVPSAKMKPPELVPVIVPKPVAPTSIHWYSGVVNWFMEK